MREGDNVVKILCKCVCVCVLAEKIFPHSFSPFKLDLDLCSSKESEARAHIKRKIRYLFLD